MWGALTVRTCGNVGMTGKLPEEDKILVINTEQLA